MKKNVKKQNSDDDKIKKRNKVFSDALKKKKSLDAKHFLFVLAGEKKANFSFRKAQYVTPYKNTCSDFSCGQSNLIWEEFDMLWMFDAIVYLVAAHYRPQQYYFFFRLINFIYIYLYKKTLVDQDDQKILH